MGVDEARLHHGARRVDHLGVAMLYIAANIGNAATDNQNVAARQVTKGIVEGKHAAPFEQKRSCTLPCGSGDGTAQFNRRGRDSKP